MNAVHEAVVKSCSRVPTASTTSASAASGRTVTVALRGTVELAGRDGEPAPAPAPVTAFLSGEDVVSLAALAAFLRSATRGADDGDTVAAGGLESTVWAVFEMLQLEGSAPAPQTIRLDAP